MKTDEYGRVIFNSIDLTALLYEGREINSDFYAEPEPEVLAYNELCRINDKLTHMLVIPETPEITPEQAHEERQQTWFLPNAYLDKDVWGELAAKCRTDAERDRLAQEQIEYEARELQPLLRLMMYLVDEFRRRNVVWGVGRGSSVASFTLYLIGIIKINPMLYGLEITDFLKD